MKKLIVMSTDEVYGSTDEIVDVRLLDPANPYSASKAAADMIVSAYQKMHPELTITTLRSNNIAGPGQFINNIIPRFSVLGLLDRKFTLHGDGSARPALSMGQGCGDGDLSFGGTCHQKPDLSYWP